MTKRTIGLMLLLIVIVGCAGTFSVQRTPARPMIVMGKDIPLHKNATWGNAIKTLQTGDSVTVIGYEGGFLYSAAGKDTGFISEGDLKSPTQMEAMNQPLEFKVPKADIEDTWGRANLFIAKYSTMKLQMATDMLLETYNPVTSTDYGYSITKTPMKDNVQITVSCTPYQGNALSHNDDEANENAHACAYYIATGNIDPASLH
jgi:hypothetical protein